MTCQTCGHDCEMLDCGDECICSEEFSESEYYAEDMNRAEQAYWDESLGREDY